MEKFSNIVLVPEDLPAIKSEEFNALDKKYRFILLIRVAVSFLTLIGGGVFFFLLNELPLQVKYLVIGGSVILFLIVYSLAITMLGFPKKGYLVREKDISYQKGLISYKMTTVPFNRIQHVEVNQGVVEKIFRLSTIKIFTAGGNASDLSIPGLPVDVAKGLKAFLSEKISEHE